MDHSFESEMTRVVGGYAESDHGPDMPDQDVSVWELESEYLAERTFTPDGVCETWDVNEVL